MYTDEDLKVAIENGIFTDSSVDAFRSSISEIRNSPSVDEENFKLIGGFNDIFIVIACGIFLFSSLWVVKSIADSDSLGLITFTVLSWGLAEFFVLKRKMALPSIVLFTSFIGGFFALILSFYASPTEGDYAVAAGLSAVFAYLHWLRFKVAITIAAGTAAGFVLLVLSSVSVFPDMREWLLPMVLFCGLASFAFAMYWDSSDTSRTSHRSDVAFWLHLLSAPLIIHPIFSALGVLGGSESFSAMGTVIVLYLLMTFVSIVIDRRAFMLSSLVYVIYALSSLIKLYGGVGYSFAITGVFMGGAILLLSAYWHRVRIFVINQLPNSVKSHVPKAKVNLTR